LPPAPSTVDAQRLAEGNATRAEESAAVVGAAAETTAVEEAEQQLRRERAALVALRARLDERHPGGLAALEAAAAASGMALDDATLGRYLAVRHLAPSPRLVPNPNSSTL
jgi:hypothetical protein